MIRPLFTEFSLFLVPFVAYALFLLATRKGVLDPAAWPLTRIAWLTLAALILMIGSFVVFATFGGVPPGSTYIPAHVDEQGVFVPAQTLPGPK